MVNRIKESHHASNFDERHRRGSDMGQGGAIVTDQRVGVIDGINQAMAACKALKVLVNPELEGAP